MKWDASQRDLQAVSECGSTHGRRTNNETEPGNEMGTCPEIDTAQCSCAKLLYYVLIHN